jgi:hypothetical protein
VALAVGGWCHSVGAWTTSWWPSAWAGWGDRRPWQTFSGDPWLPFVLLGGWAFVWPQLSCSCAGVCSCGHECCVWWSAGNTATGSSCCVLVCGCGVWVSDTACCAPASFGGWLVAQPSMHGTRWAEVHLSASPGGCWTCCCNPMLCEGCGVQHHPICCLMISHPVFGVVRLAGLPLPLRRGRQPCAQQPPGCAPRRKGCHGACPATVSTTYT